MQNTALLGDSLDNTSRHSLALVNIGMNTTINVRADINYYDFTGDILKKDLFNSKRIIQKDEIFQFELGIPRDENKHIIIIKIQDLLENNYEQEISFGYKDSKMKIFSNNPVMEDKE